MATESSLLHDGGCTASADCSAHQYNFVKVSGADTVTFCAANSDVAVGILQNDPVSGDAADIGIAGRSKIVVGAAVTTGDRLMPDSAGRGITATGSGAVAGAIALETATAINQIISCLVNVATRVYP